MILEKARLFARNCGDTGGKEKFLSTRWLEGFKRKHKSTEQPQLQPSKAALHGPQSSSIPGSPMVHYRSTRNPANMIRCSGTNPEVIEALNPASYSRPVTVSPVSPSGTPTLDEARRALQLIVNYFQHQTTDLYPQEYVTIGKLMERLDLVKDQINTPPGELSRKGPTQR